MKVYKIFVATVRHYSCLLHMWLTRVITNAGYACKVPHVDSLCSSHSPSTKRKMNSRETEERTAIPSSMHRKTTCKTIGNI